MTLQTRMSLYEAIFFAFYLLMTTFGLVRDLLDVPDFAFSCPSLEC